MTRDSYTGWHKASYSNSTGGCVEVGMAVTRHEDGDSPRRVIGVRDTRQHGSGPILAFSPAAWRAFLSTAKAGSFDL
jgi:uncharacterized protein DUF397